MPLFSKHIPKYDRAGFAFKIVDLKLLRALDHIRVVCAWLTEPSEIAFHVRHKHGHTAGAKILCEGLQRDRFSSSGGAGDQAVTIRHLGQEKDRFFRLRNEDGISHGCES